MRSNKFRSITAMLIAVVMALGMFIVPSFTATATSTSTTTDPSVVVTPFTAKIIETPKKVKKCVERAKKHETRPADPRVRCKGKIKVNVSGTAHAYCPAPYLGGDATVSFTQKITVRVYAYAEAVGSTAKVMAKTKAVVIMRGKLVAKVTCVLPPGVAPTTTVTATATPSCPPGNIWNPVTGQCAKDGSTVPSPPATAPGPNPSPSDTVSARCYWEATGLPVDPSLIIAGQCPPGSRRY